MTDLEQEISNALVEEITRAIDQDVIDSVMIDVLREEGWTQTRVHPALDPGPALSGWYADTAEWIHLNAMGDYKLLKGQWLFEKPEDATMFLLRWS